MVVRQIRSWRTAVWSLNGFSETQRRPFGLHCPRVTSVSPTQSECAAGASIGQVPSLPGAKRNRMPVKDSTHRSPALHRLGCCHSTREHCVEHQNSQREELPSGCGNPDHPSIPPCLRQADTFPRPF